MNRREELQERYEDALFALLMDDTAQDADPQAQREALSPAEEMPEELDRRCRQLIDKRFGAERRRRSGRWLKAALSRAVAAVGVCSLTFTAAFAASEEVRVNTLNLIVENFGTHMDFSVKSDGPAITSTSTEHTIDPQWLPEGYTLTQDIPLSSDHIKNYENDDGDWISISITHAAHAGIMIDTEDATIEAVNLHGTSATFVQKGTELHAIWLSTDKSAFVDIISSNLSRDDFFRLANSLQYT